MKEDKVYMSAALEEAQAAAARDEVPIGAVAVHRETGEIVARSGNRTRELNDPTAHAEVLVIRAVCKQEGAQRIPDYDLFVTLEPCTQCAGAISFARFGRVVFGATDAKGGAVISGVRFFDTPTCHHKPEISHGIMADKCGEILKAYFRSKR